MTELRLISHNLCPYVQRGVISLSEKKIPFERIDIDLSNKPDWFKAISPLGKTPVLRVGPISVFESSVILEYLEETEAYPLHPEDPLQRAEHRSWIEFGSAILSDIAGLYNAADEQSFGAKVKMLKDRFAWIEKRLVASPYFDGNRFTLVDAVFGPIFRYFDSFDRIGDFGILTDNSRTMAWRTALADRPSIKRAVARNYDHLLWAFLKARNSYLSQIMPD